MCEVIVLQDGYSLINDDGDMLANCSCSLVKGLHNIIVDTLTAWDSQVILNALHKENMTPEQIDYVVSSHGHSDHIGNNNLFLKATHIVGFSISFKDKYYIHPFEKGEEYIINDFIKIIPTPGHTLSDVTVLVTTKDGEVTAITGDLFEKCEDIETESIWREAGSEDYIKQKKNRSMVANIANWIIPGHGPKFKVTSEIRELLEKQSSVSDYKVLKVT